MSAKNSLDPVCVCVCVCVIDVHTSTSRRRVAVIQVCVHARPSCLEVFTKEGDTFICDCVIAEIQMSHEGVSRQCLDQYLNILH